MKIERCLLLISAFLLCIFYNRTFAQNIDTLYRNHTLELSDSTKMLIWDLGNSINFVQVFDIKRNVLKEEMTEVNSKLNGCYKEFYPNGQIKVLQNFLMDVPIGIVITFYENGVINTIYDYGYNDTDIYLKPKIYSYSGIDSVTNEMWGGSYHIFKPKNGKEYVYSEDGSLAEIIKYFDNKCLRVLSYDKNGNVTEKECPKE